MPNVNISPLSAEDLIDESGSVDLSVATAQPRPMSKGAKLVPLPAALIALFIFAQMFDYHALHLATFTPDKLFFLVILLFFGNAALSGRLRSVPWSGTEVCMVMFATLCTASYCITNPDAGLENFKWLTTLFNLIVYPFALYFLVKKTRYRARKTIWLLRAMVCIGSYLAFTASFEHYGINALVFPKYIVDPHVGIQFGRARGPMVGSNPMGEWLVVVFLVTCLIMPFARVFTKILLYGLLLLVTMGIYFTLTRGAWISFAAAVLITAMLGGKSFGIQSRLIIVVVLVAFFVGAGSKFSFSGQTLFTRRLNTIDYRLSNNETTFNMGMANPLTGVGYGSFFSNWERYFGYKEKQLTVDLTDGNHNTFLGLFADMGVPGVALYVALFGFLFRESLRVRKALDPRAHLERSLALTSVCLLTISVIEAMSGDLRFNPTLNAVTFLFAGITASLKYAPLIQKKIKRTAASQKDIPWKEAPPELSEALPSAIPQKGLEW